MTVEYRDIPDFPGYRAGDDGSVWSRRSLNGIGPHVQTWRQLYPQRDKYGYHQVTLRVGGKRFLRKVHRLVLEAFVGPRPPRMEARHFPDRSRSNNALSNLSWATAKQNAEDRLVHGTELFGERCHFAKLLEVQVRAIRAAYATGKFTQRQLAAEYKSSQGTIGFILRGETWRHPAPS